MVETLTRPLRRSHAQKREETRGKILQAALDIIVEEGMRSVRNRAIAKRAGVSLGSTTYHFSSIEDLIISAFQTWSQRTQIGSNPFYQETSELLAPFGEGSVPPKQRASAAAFIFEIAVDYVLDQLTRGRQDRLLELAFYHESVRYPALRAMLHQEWQAQLNILASIHNAMGSNDPDTDAMLTAAVFRHLESTLTLAGNEQPNKQLIDVTLRRHLAQCFDIAIPG
ncbi:hypothetical protein A3709_07990 [Halioglobus sp. HI00S01]|uniref:TetR/AcrR family transcriptional regulator n=1 Tax=Halioglobus sp. HI00S01 TaxID=1822214 RepID=UPI0007C3F24C|nr:TetR family transcriptional regulator [Halioglobus sp. HI00S01]KZX54941.1 hypothetical protein A3709_07990 [Halioglobus sp. HI00S01]